jgi:hypothetical protein
MTGWQTTLPSLVALFAALVALTTPFIAADRADRSRWREQRRATYDTFLATCAVRRRRLEAQARRMSAGLTPKDAEERDEARESVVADWNRVNLATGSDALRQAAEGLLIVVDDLRALLDSGRPITEQHLESLQSRWDGHRGEYIRQARLDLNLPRS